LVEDPYKASNAKPMKMTKPKKMSMSKPKMAMSKPKMPHTTKPKKMSTPHLPKPRQNTTKHNVTHKAQPNIAQPQPVTDNLATIGYQEATGVRYMYYSYAAYCDASDITNWSCQWCSGDDYALTGISTVDDSATNTFGFVGYNAAHNEIVVSFRGTEPTSLTNWISDLSFAKTDLEFSGVSGAHVHQGFYDAYNAVSQDVLNAVQALQSQYPSASVYFTGHSLGGAIATLATLDAAVSWGVSSDQLGHFTFGSPRVGDSTFASAFTEYVGANNHYRVVNDDDLVPHVPMEIMGFHHVSTEVWLHDNTETVCNSSGEDPSCSDSVIGVSIYDHLHYYGYQQTC